MGCGASTPSSSEQQQQNTSVVPGIDGDKTKGGKQEEEGKDGSQDEPIKRKLSGADMQLREALSGVFETNLLQPYGSKKGQAENILTRDDFIEKVFPALCKGAEIPPPTSPEFIAMAETLFEHMDTNKNKRMSTEEFVDWYIVYGHDTVRNENESFMAQRFFKVIKKMVRWQEDELAKAWLKQRGGFTEEEVEYVKQELLIILFLLCSLIIVVLLVAEWPTGSILTFVVFSFCFSFCFCFFLFLFLVSLRKALTGLFKVYDANGDGELDEVEFGNMMLEVMDARLEALGQRTKGIAHDRLSRKAAAAIIVMMDEDGNGTLDMKEFQGTLAASLKWTEDRVDAAAQRLSAAEPKLAAHLKEFFQAMTWCVGKFIKQGGAKRAINLSRFFDSGPDPDAYWHQS